MNPHLRALLPLIFLAAVILSAGYHSSKLHEPVVGDVTPESAAFKAGFRSGDRIASVNSKPVDSWEQVALERGTYSDAKTAYSVVRESGEQAEVAVDTRDPRGCVEGLSNRWMPAVTALRENSPFAIYGVSNGDLVKSVNGVQVGKWRELEEVLAKQDAGKPLNVDLERADGKGESHSIAVAPFAQPYSANSLGLDNPALVAGKVKSGSVAYNLGIQTGDRLLLIQGRKITAWQSALEVAAVMSSQKKIELDVVRGPQVHRLEAENPKWTSIDVGTTLFEFLGVSTFGKTQASSNTNRRDPALWVRYMMGPCS